MMTGKKSFGAERFESKLDDGLSRFLRQSPAPIFRTEMKSEFAHAIFDLIGTQPRTPGVLPVLEKKNRPILHVASGHRGDFFR
jgi:hypothetical protein